MSSILQWMPNMRPILKIRTRIDSGRIQPRKRWTMTELYLEFWRTTPPPRRLEESHRPPNIWCEDGFLLKKWWILDGHNNPYTIGSIYAGVMSRYSVWIVFTYAALNKLDVCVADIQKVYLQAPSMQKDFIIWGPESGLEHIGKR